MIFLSRNVYYLGTYNYYNQYFFLYFRRNIILLWMESLSAGTGVMSAVDRTSESSRLVGPSSNAAKPSYMNLFSNLCSIIFLGIIIYCCFTDGVTLFSFHPSLMTLGVSVFTSLIEKVSSIFLSSCVPFIWNTLLL